MELRKILKYLFLNIVLLSISCKSDNSNDFNQKVIQCYNAHNKIITLHQIFDFKWDKMFIISPYHYPEANTRGTISKIIKAPYNEDKILFERLFIFTKNNNVVCTIRAYYEKENPIDYKPLLVDFILDENTPKYFLPNSRFSINKENDLYYLEWIDSAPNLVVGKK